MIEKKTKQIMISHAKNKREIQWNKPKVIQIGDQQ